MNAPIEGAGAISSRAMTTERAPGSHIGALERWLYCYPDERSPSTDTDPAPDK